MLTKGALLVLVILLGISSCKNKKKAADVTDQEAAQELVVEEIAAEEEADENTTTYTRVAVKEPTKTEKLESYFGIVANSPLSAANSNMTEVMGMFSDPSAPVLIVIYNEDGTTDYDEPTTIKKYLEYLKDTKNNKAKVEEMVLDDSGKIKELVLKK